MHSKLIFTSFICLFLSACDGQEQTAVINKTTETNTIEIKAVPEKTPQQKIRPALKQTPKPALNLTIDDISIDQDNQDGIFNLDKEIAETHSDTFETLSRDQAEPSYNLSGKILTDEEKMDKKEYLNAVDGLQINIEGSFQ